MTWSWFGRRGCAAPPAVIKLCDLVPSWVLVVTLSLVEKQLIFTSKWTTAWHHGVIDVSLNIHLQSFHSPIIVEEERPSLETHT